MAINCDCDDATGYRTLGQLRSAVLGALGFIDPITGVTTKTLGALRAAIKLRFGFIDPITNAPMRTLLQLRESIISRLGFFDALTDTPTRTLSAMRIEIKARMGFIDPIASAPTRTLLQLRTSIKARLGFFDPLTSPPTKTLAALRTEALTLLGLADPLGTAQTRALSDLRDDLLIRMGNAAMVGVTLPPGMADLLDSFINESEQTLFRRMELDQGSVAAPSRMSVDTDVTTLDYVPVLNLATALALAHNGKGDAKAYFEIVEKYLADVARRRPPNIAELVDAALIEAQQAVYRRYEMGQSGVFTLSAFAADGDVTSLDYQPVLMLAVANLKSQVGLADAKPAMDAYEQYMADQMRRAVPGLDTLVNNLLIEAQETAFRRYELGKDTYALDAFAADGDATTLDYKPVELLATANTKAYFKQDDARVYLEQYEKYMADALTRSPPGVDDQVDAALRQAQEAAYRRYEMGNSGAFALNPLAADTDTTTIDYHPVQLLALATMKAKAGQGDAKEVLEEYERYMADHLRRAVPGLTGLVNRMIAEAQETVFRRYELGNIAYTLAALAADTDATSIDYKPVELLSTASAKTYFKQDDAATYFQQYESYMADALRRSPPGGDTMLNVVIKDAREQVARRYQVASSFPLAAFDADTDDSVIDYVPIEAMAMAALAERIGGKDAKAYADAAERYFADMERRQPANAVGLVTGFVQDAQRQIVRRYPALRVDRWFSWSLAAGERFYDLPANDEQTDAAPCAKRLDPLAIKWAGVTDGTARYELRRGIPPQLLDHDITGKPSHYEIKQCIELWPAPAASEGALRIRAGFKPTAFIADADAPTVDDEAVYLLALANAKAYFKQTDAGNVIQQFEVHLHGLVAGSHGAARYVPGPRHGDGVYTEPRPTVPFT